MIEPGWVSGAPSCDDRSALKRCSAWTLRGPRVLDVGTGSGVLGLSGGGPGAARVLAIGRRPRRAGECPRQWVLNGQPSGRRVPPGRFPGRWTSKPRWSWPISPAACSRRCGRTRTDRGSGGMLVRAASLRGTQAVYPGFTGGFSPDWSARGRLVLAPLLRSGPDSRPVLQQQDANGPADECQKLEKRESSVIRAPFCF